MPTRARVRTVIGKRPGMLTYTGAVIVNIGDDETTYTGEYMTEDEAERAVYAAREQIMHDLSKHGNVQHTAPLSGDSRFDGPAPSWARQTLRRE